VEREAFARAWKFLRFSPIAKWTAFATAVTSGILYVLLLIILGLYADLMVNRGKIPAYRDMPLTDRESFLQRWQDTSIEDRKKLLTSMGIAAAPAEELAALGGAPGNPVADEKNINSLGAQSLRVKSVLWRADVHHVLVDRVGTLAGALTLPDLRDLPDNVQNQVRQEWLSLTPEDRTKRFAFLGEENAKTIVSADPAGFFTKNPEMVWRAHVYQFLKENAGESVAEAFWIDRTSGYGARHGADELRDHELEDRGTLSMVVRTHGHPPFGAIAGGFARAVPISWRSSSTTRPNFLFYLSGLLGLGVALTLLRAFSLYALNGAAAACTLEAANRLRRAVYHHTFRLGRLAFRSLGPSEAVGVFTRQIETLHHGLYVSFTVAIAEPIKFLLLLALALTLNLWLSLAFITFALLVWLIGGQVAVYFRRQERDATQASADQLALLQESLMMMRLVKCYLMELFNQSRVERQLVKYTQAQTRRYRGEAIYRPLLVLLGTLAAVALLYVAGLIVLSGRLGVASAITLATALVSLYLPLVHWLDSLRLLRKAREAAGIVFKFLDRPGEVGQVVGAEFLSPLGHALEFQNVSLQEPGTGRKLLQGVNLNIRAGQRIALVGPEEAQKHALVYLIPRFLDPTAGEILIDKHDLRWVTFDSLRAQIAMVMQHNLVFNDKVANNISCGDASYDLPKIIEASKIAHAHHFIQKLPKGYETVIGEMGQYLSVSEQFRIGLARAILRDPALLIIEEPMAALDEDTKSLVDDTYARILPGRTVIFLPHRISTIRSCDRVFLLHKGRVEAAGEHRELLTQSDLYKHLHYMEFNEFAEQL
jgi:ATP-binding cassette subfamily B protein